MNQIKKYDLKYSYDREVDSIHIRIADEYEYNESLEIEEGIILDFSKDDIPVALEILDISELFCINKDYFDNIDNINVTIEITSSSISLNLLIEASIQDKVINQPFSTITKNFINVPEISVICSY